MKVGKPKSKRVPVRLRHKIEKKSAAKQRKDRKLARKDPTWRTKLKKDPGIPNLFPYKDRVLREIEDGKKRKEEDATRRRELERAQRQGVAVPDGPVGAVDDDPDALLDLEDESDADMDVEGEANAGSEDPMAALLASARARAARYERDNADEEDEEDEDEDAMEDDDDAANNSSFEGLSPPPTTSSHRTTEPSSNRPKSQKSHHSAAISQLIASSDVLLYILDARDPQSTRSPAIEQAILSDPEKRLILVVNKIDLVPAPALRGWLTHLRRSFPTLPLRAGASAPGAKTFDHRRLTPHATADALVAALKHYAAARRGTTTVGVLGLPNVGKSSAVNALVARLGRRRGAGAHCPVGAEAGITTALRQVRLDGGVTLVDSPGVVFPGAAAAPPDSSKKSSGKRDTADAHARLVLLNAVPPRDIADPVPAVSLLLARLAAADAHASPQTQTQTQTQTQMQKLLDVYGIAAIAPSAGTGAGAGAARDLTTPFLIEVARKRGRLGRGGVPDLHAAALAVVADWRDGRIQAWTDPPASPAGGGEEGGPAGTEKMGKDAQVVVKGWAEEFKIEGLWGGDGDDEEAEEGGGDVAMAWALGNASRGDVCGT